MPEKDIKLEELDPILHERVRLAIMVLLSETEELDYNTIRGYLEVTDGNLASHLRKLEDHGLIKVRKTFKGRRPRTYYSLTEKGREKLLSYLAALKSLISRVKESP